MKNREYKAHLFNLQLCAEENLIVSADLARVRDIDFVARFTAGIQSLQAMLGTGRPTAKIPGTQLRSLVVTGELQDGVVDEGAVIPLSNYKTTWEVVGDVVLNKYRKATSIEAITEKGYDQAVNATSDKMLRDIQKKIRASIITALQSGTGRASGVGLQSALAQGWGQLQVLFDDIDIQAVFFINPLDVADYLGSAQITLQTAFGFSYLENFLGLGTAILIGSIPKGTFFATAVENMNLYYVNANDPAYNDFDFMTDETGLIGISTYPAENRLTVNSSVICGVGIFFENLSGVVVGTITAGASASEAVIQVGAKVDEAVEDEGA